MQLLEVSLSLVFLQLLHAKSISALVSESFHASDVVRGKLGVGLDFDF